MLILADSKFLTEYSNKHMDESDLYRGLPCVVAPADATRYKIGTAPPPPFSQQMALPNNIDDEVILVVSETTPSLPDTARAGPRSQSPDRFGAS